MGLTFARTNMENISGITPNKLYMSARWETTGNQMYIINDRGTEIFILEKGCAFLLGGSWEFIRPSELGELI